MKVLFLVQDMDCAKILKNIPELKIINEREISADSPYADNYLKPGYSTYVVSRAANLSKIYRFARPLAIVLYQNHQIAVNKIPHDISIRITNHILPRRLTDIPTYRCDYTFIANELTENKLRDILKIYQVS
jgi:hypothetical protein